jgi:hypothetical protein
MELPAEAREPRMNQRARDIADIKRVMAEELAAGRDPIEEGTAWAIDSSADTYGAIPN